MCMHGEIYGNLQRTVAIQLSQKSASNDFSTPYDPVNFIIIVVPIPLRCSFNMTLCIPVLLSLIYHITNCW